MSVRPVDLQNTIARVPEANRGLGDQNNASQAQGIQHPDVIDEKLTQEQNTTPETTSSEKSPQIRKREEDNRRRVFIRKKSKIKKKEEEKKKEEIKDETRGNIIDIKI